MKIDKDFAMAYVRAATRLLTLVNQTLSDKTLPPLI